MLLNFIPWMNIFLMFCNMKYGIHLSHFWRTPKHNGYLEENHMHNYLICKLAKNLSCLHAQPLSSTLPSFSRPIYPPLGTPCPNQDAAGRGTSGLLIMWPAPGEANDPPPGRQMTRPQLPQVLPTRLVRHLPKMAPAKALPVRWSHVFFMGWIFSFFFF